MKAFVGVSDSVVADYQRALGWNIHRIYNGIPLGSLPGPLSDEARSRVRRELGVPHDRFLLAVPGRYAPEKGHSILCRALQILKARKGWVPDCVAAGDGPEREKIKEMLATLGLTDSFRLLEAMPQSQLFELLQASDAVVLPSLREPFGIAAAEAMALGCPTILTDTDGFKEVAGDQRSALLVPPGDPAALSEAIWKLYSDPALQSDLSRRGKQRIQRNFDIAKLADEWVELFEGTVRR